MSEVSVIWHHERAEDLKVLNDRRNDTSLPNHSRAIAEASYQKILRQVDDKKLQSLRSQLRGAVHADDHITIEKLELQIREHARTQNY